MGALRDFVADLLDGEGAAIEPVEPDGLDVLAPEPLRAAMGWPELARLGFGAQLPPEAVGVRLEGDWLDRFGSLLMAIMFVLVGWRAAVGGIDMQRNGETSMLLGFPIWVGYAAMLPGVFLAGIVALAQSCGIKVAEPVAEHVRE